MKSATWHIDIDGYLMEEYDLDREEVHDTVKHVCRAVDPEIECQQPLDTEAKKKFARRLLLFIELSDLPQTEKDCGREHLLACGIDRNCPNRRG